MILLKSSNFGRFFSVNSKVPDDDIKQIVVIIFVLRSGRLFQAAYLDQWPSANERLRSNEGLMLDRASQTVDLLETSSAAAMLTIPS